MRMYRTRFSELGYRHFSAEFNIDEPLWRFVDTESGKPVGPYYKSEQELLADIDRYAAQYGCAPRARDKLNIVVYHGEHRTLFYVVVSSQSDVDWTVIKTFTDRDAAREFIANYKTAWPADFE